MYLEYMDPVRNYNLIGLIKNKIMDNKEKDISNGVDELSQILKHEEDNKNKLALTEQKAKQEIEQKEEQLKDRLEKESALTEQEKASLLAEKEQRIKKIERETEEKLQVKLKELENVNKEKALQYISKSLLGD